MGNESYLEREVQVSSGKETMLNVLIQEKLNSLDAVVILPKTNKGRALNSMATVSARMLSVEEATRYGGGFDDPARLVSAFAGVSSGV